MKIQIMSKNMAEKHIGGRGVQCISLTSSIETDLVNPRFNNILRITVDDITPNTLLSYIRKQAWEELNFCNIFDSKMLEKIKGFSSHIKRNMAQGLDTTLVVHCSAGISRSSAVACLVMEHLNLDYDWVFKDNKYEPNKHICGFLKNKSEVMKKYLEVDSIDKFRKSLEIDEDGNVSLAVGITDEFSLLENIIIDQLGVDEMTPKSNFRKDLGADSLDEVELIMAIEDEYDIEIPDEVAEKIETVEDAITVIRERTNK